MLCLSKVFLSLDNTNLEKVPVSHSLQYGLRMNGGYGWVIVFATFLIVFFPMGLNSAFGIYFSFYLDHGAFKGGGRIDYAIIGGISF